MVRAEKKIVFLSHAWEDRTIVQPFKDAFFGDTTFNQDAYECFFTSDPSDPSIPPGVNIWTQIEEKLLRCEYFVAFCSPNYFKSQTCQNELGAIKALSARKKGNSIQIIPVKLADFHPSYINHIISQSSIYIDPFQSSGVKEIAKLLNSVLNFATLQAYERVAQEVKKARDDLAQSKDHRVVSLWQKHLTDRSYPNTPVTFFIEVCQYPDVAVGLSKKGGVSLVWALNRSPLLVAAAYDSQTEYLMAHELRFEMLQTKNKYRLVIFKEWKEAEAYQQCSPKYHKDETGVNLTQDQLEKRRKDFRDSVEKAGAKLLFTTRSRIKRTTIFQYAGSLGEDYWDFGYVKTDVAADAEFLFVSGFDSPSFVTDPGQLHSKSIRHLALYSKPHDDRYEVLRKPQYATLYGPFRGLFDVVDSLLSPSAATANVFVTEKDISKLQDQD
ncbi:MAG: toll/interleukin-1 receptor domain-containing protein [Anaerolineales bacterium]